MRVVFRRLTVEIDLVPAGIATFLILVGVGIMNHLTPRPVLRDPSRAELARRPLTAAEGRTDPRAD